jgi:DNA-binding transcriptional ArsR family regulator
LSDAIGRGQISLLKRGGKNAYEVAVSTGCALMERPLSVSGNTTALAKPALDVDGMLDNAREASAFLKALTHESRLVILCLLIERDRTVGELEQLLNQRQAAVSQQLARLRADDLVETRREGKNVYYSIARPEVVEIIGSLYRAFCKR